MKKNFIYLAFSLSCIGMLFSCTSEMDEFDDFQNAVVSRSVSTTSSLHIQYLHLHKNVLFQEKIYLNLKKCCH